MACCCEPKNCDCSCSCCLFVNNRNTCETGNTEPNQYPYESWQPYFQNQTPYTRQFYRATGPTNQTQQNPYYYFWLVDPTCSAGDGWQILNDWKLVIYSPYRTNQFFINTAQDTYRMRPTISCDSDGCPTIQSAEFEFVSRYDTGLYPPFVGPQGKTVAEVLAGLALPGDLASSIALQCTPPNPLP